LSNFNYGQKPSLAERKLSARRPSQAHGLYLKKI
jgi:hypothetical protein